MKCMHCGTQFSGMGKFCCAGCESVFGFLESRGLGRYYDLRDEFSPRGAAPVIVATESFLDLEPRSSGEMDFYLEGIHCLGCLWVLEKLPELLPGVLQAKLDFGNSVLHVAIREQTNFQAVARLLQQLGYRPHPLKETADTYQKRENRALLLRLGVAAFCTGNIMLLSVSLYSGAQGALAAQFAWLSLALCLPVLFYCATPLYQSAWSGLRARALSVDLPIVLALFAGVAASLLSLLDGLGKVYFDSLSMLVFLLLTSRYLLRRLQQKHMSDASLLDFLESDRIDRLVEGKKEEIPLSALRVGDRIFVASGRSLPCDGIIRGGSAYLDLSLLTGESAPELVKSGEVAFAGTKNLGDDVELECSTTGENTRLGRILAQLHSPMSVRTPFTSFADGIAKWFVGIVFGLALLVLARFYGRPVEGLNRALALVIVTCPCVLAFAVPLSLTLSARLAAKRGILLKSPETLEALSKVEEIFFDKTGTLTEGDFQVLSWNTELDFPREEMETAVYSLEWQSRHPVARALVRYLEGRARAVPVSDFREKPGEGLEGKTGEVFWQIRRSSGENQVDILREGKLVGQITLGDRLREEAPVVLEGLGSRKLALLSGDRAGVAARIGRELGIPNERIFSERSAEEKAEIVRAHPRSLMVGDGANDALALKSAMVGVAVQGSVELSLKNADLFFSRPGLRSLADLFQIAAKNRRVTIRNLIFSALYNVAAGALAITGHMNPLWAAVIMPLSALTVFFSTAFSYRGAA